MKKRNIYIFRIILLLFFIAWSVFFYYASPAKIISYIGIENAYGLMFILALLGGLTTFSGVPYHAILIMLASGGLNPLYLGLSASFGVMFGDSTSYYIGYNGAQIVPQKIQKYLKRFCVYCLDHPKILPFAFFLYGSIVPFSNDFIVISMGMARYPFWKVMLPLGLGNVVFNTTLAYLAVYAYSFIKHIFLTS
jgi:membrane protein YqaA with SNARE-associated domain